MNYYTSDTHFAHKNIIKYCNRPFESVEHMDQVLIDNINQKVKSNDVLYHLGDFAMLGRGPEIEVYNKLRDYRKRINCRNIVLIYGNHDEYIKRDGYLREFFNGCYDYLEIKENNKDIILFHYAMKVWNQAHYGAWHLWGHSHYSLPDDPNALSIDVGVDNPLCNFSPFNFDEIKEIMGRKTWKAVDLHGKS